MKFSGWFCTAQPPVWAHQCLLLLPAELMAYLGKAGHPVGLVLLAQKDLDLLCSGNRVSTLGIVTQIQLHFRADVQIHWRQVPRRFEILICVNLSLYCPNCTTNMVLIGLSSPRDSFLKA